MGLFDALFSKEINKRVNQTVSAALVKLYNQNMYRMFNDGQVILEADNFDYVAEAFNTVGAVYECVTLIADKVKACPRIVYRVKNQKEYKKYLNYSKSSDTLPQALIAKAKSLEEVELLPVEKLPENPNDLQNGDDFIELITALLLLRGNSYLYGNGPNSQNKKWKEVWCLPADMKIVSGGLFEPIKEYILNYWDADPFPAAQIKHLKTLNPSYTTTGQQLYGTPPLRPYLYSLDIIKNADKQSDKQMKNGGKLGIISPKNKEDQFETEQKGDMKESISRAHASDDTLARIIPASVALDWTEIGLSSSELEVLETSGAKSEDIYRGFKIPLQFRNQDTATYNNLPVANRQLVYNAVAPWCRKIEKALTEFYCTPYNTATETHVIHLDYTSLPELNDDMKTVAAWLDLCWDLTPNEKREVKGWGKSNQAGMDEIWVDKKMVRMQDVLDGKIDQSTHTAAATPNDPSSSGTPSNAPQA